MKTDYYQMIAEAIEAVLNIDVAQKIFINYGWPGNVRELQNVIEYAVNFAETPIISENLICRRLNINSDIR